MEVSPAEVSAKVVPPAGANSADAAAAVAGTFLSSCICVFFCNSCVAEMMKHTILFVVH